MEIGRWVFVWLVVVCMALAGGDAFAQQQPKAKAPAAAAKVDLNSASQAELEALPGVGEATAKKIVAGRPYKSVADLEKAGVNKATIEKITPLVTVGAAPADAKKTTAKATEATKSTETAKAGTTAKATDVAAKKPPQKGMVWVNTDSGIFHKEGDRWYGKTKQGEFMTEADALKKGYREAKN
jgi:hypothetical protein